VSKPKHEPWYKPRTDEDADEELVNWLGQRQPPAHGNGDGGKRGGGCGLWILTGLVAVALLALVGCENQADPASLPDGVTNISKNMRGVWNAPGGPGCKWSVRVKSGGRWVTVNSGAGNHSQTAIIGTAHVGGQFRSDKCANKAGGWKR
jgi:hypothetical protein